MQGLCEKELRVRSLYDMDNKKGFTMKTKEELNALKERIETLSKELRALSDEELEYVTGGVGVMNEKLYMSNTWSNSTQEFYENISRYTID